MRFDEARRLTLTECEAALGRIGEAETEQLLRLIGSAEQIFFVGVGRVLLALQAVCKRLAHLGFSAHCVGGITEPAITRFDLLIVGSGSGESLFPAAIAGKAREIGAAIAYIGSNRESTVARLADLMVRVPVRTKLGLDDELPSGQPMTSLFEQCLLLYGDMLAKMLIENRSIDMQGLWRRHANLE